MKALSVRKISNQYQLFWNLDFLRAAILDVVTFYGCHYYLYHPLGNPVNKEPLFDNNNGNRAGNSNIKMAGICFIGLIATCEMYKPWHGPLKLGPKLTVLCRRQVATEMGRQMEKSGRQKVVCKIFAS